MSLKDPKETIIGWLLNVRYNVSNFIDKRDDKLEITRFEQSTSSIAVAWVCGAVPGIVIGKMGLPVWIVAPLAFASSWWVCENLFPIAHEYYGSGSIWHRIYDLNSVGSGILMYYVVKK